MSGRRPDDVQEEVAGSPRSVAEWTPSIIAAAACTMATDENACWTKPHPRPAVARQMRHPAGVQGGPRVRRMAVVLGYVRAGGHVLRTSSVIVSTRRRNDGRLTP